MAYERQISPTSIDELSTLNCSATLGFVGLTATDIPPDEHNSHNSQGKDFALPHLLIPWDNILEQFSALELHSEVFLGVQLC